jgi:hypothetical protein
MPPFFNHYPTKESDNYRGLFNDTTIEEIREADANVRASISFHSRDIVVMFGARPTLLYPNPQRRNYLASVCPYVDLYWLQKDICGFVVWWPDTGLLNHTHMACYALLKQIWQLAAHKLHVLVCKLNEVAENTVEVEPKQAYDILNWLKDHPTSLQLDVTTQGAHHHVDKERVCSNGQERNCHTVPVHDAGHPTSSGDFAGRS